MKIFFDGGWRPATGMEWAVVARGCTRIAHDLGPGDAMTAEWLALIAAMGLAATELARAEGVTGAVLLGDAAAVIAQAHGRVRVPPAYRALAERFATLSGTTAGVRLRHIRRTQNLAGIALARLTRTPDP